MSDLFDNGRSPVIAQIPTRPAVQAAPPDPFDRELYLDGLENEYRALMQRLRWLDDTLVKCGRKSKYTLPRRP